MDIDISKINEKESRRLCLLKSKVKHVKYKLDYTRLKRFFDLCTPLSYKHQNVFLEIIDNKQQPHQKFLTRSRTTTILFETNHKPNQFDLVLDHNSSRQIITSVIIGDLIFVLSVIRIGLVKRCYKYMCSLVSRLNCTNNL